MDLDSPRFTAVLPEIFKFLPAEDRKKVRLACHKWKYACDHPAIVKREKFVFRPSHDDEDDLTSLAMSIRQCKIIRSHFEFHGLTLWQFPTSLWEYCGDHLESLFLHECEVTGWTIFDIILHCSNLISLHLQFTSCSAVGRSEIFCSESTLDDLIRLNVERRSLRSFKLFSPSFLPNEMCRKIFQIYPNIRTFGRDYSSWCKMRSLTYGNDFRIHLESQLEFPPMMENLSFITSPGQYNVYWMLPFCMEARPKLKEVEVTVVLSHFDMDIARHFFSYQTELEKISLLVMGGIEADVKSFLFHVMNSSPKLKTFEFRTLAKILLNVEELGELLRGISRLESLGVDFHEFAFKSDSSSLELQLPSVRFDKLTKLRACLIEKEGGVEKIYAEIFNRCCFLQHLSVGPIEVDINLLRRLFTNHPGLRTLHLSCKKTEGDDRGSVGRECQPLSSVRRLQNLENLEVRCIKYDTLVLLLSEFDFPNLEHFHDGSSRTESDTFNLLNIVSMKAPSLEYLRLDSSFNLYLLGTDEFTSYLERLKRLKFFSASIEEYCLKNRRRGIKTVFVDCPSLSYVDAQDTFLYFYERHSKTLKWHVSTKASFYNDCICDIIPKLGGHIFQMTHLY